MIVDLSRALLQGRVTLYTNNSWITLEFSQTPASMDNSRRAREIMHLVVSISALTAKNNNLYYQSKVFACVSVISGRMRMDQLLYFWVDRLLMSPISGLLSKLSDFFLPWRDVSGFPLGIDRPTMSPEGLQPTVQPMGTHACYFYRIELIDIHNPCPDFDDPTSPIKPVIRPLVLVDLSVSRH